MFEKFENEKKMSCAFLLFLQVLPVLKAINEKTETHLGFKLFRNH